MATVTFGNFTWKETKSCYINDELHNPNSDGSPLMYTATGLQNCLQWCHNMDKDYSCEYATYKDHTNNCWAKTKSLENVRVGEYACDSKHWSFYTAVDSSARFDLNQRQAGCYWQNNPDEASLYKTLGWTLDQYSATLSYNEGMKKGVNRDYQCHTSSEISLLDS